MAHNHNMQEHFTEESRSKRQLILDAAYKVFSRKGYNRATVDEIIALADTGKGTVYNYFTNKEQLFYTLFQERNLPFEAALEQVVASKKPDLEKIEMMIRLFLHYYKENSDIWRVLIHEIRGVELGCSAITPATRDKFQHMYENVAGKMERVIADGIANGALRDFNVSKASYALLGVIMTLVYHDNVGADIAAEASGITEIFLHGMARKE